MMPGLEIWQKILLKCRVNLQTRAGYFLGNLVEKVKATKIGLPIIICKTWEVFDDI
jgi:hypothetical protein